MCSLMASIDFDIRPAEQTDGDAILELIEYFFCYLYVCFL